MVLHNMLEENWTPFIIWKKTDFTFSSFSTRKNVEKRLVLQYGEIFLWGRGPRPVFPNYSARFSSVNQAKNSQTIVQINPRPHKILETNYRGLAMNWRFRCGFVVRFVTVSWPFRGRFVDLRNDPRNGRVSLEKRTKRVLSRLQY